MITPKKQEKTPALSTVYIGIFMTDTPINLPIIHELAWRMSLGKKCPANSERKY